MGFREREKTRLIELKASLFSAGACAPGYYGESKRDFCLADEHSVENLHHSIRGEALAYFQNRGVPWHSGLGVGRSLPSNHLCCSQSACVNFWFPFVRNGPALGHVLKELRYDVTEVLPFEADQRLADGQFPYVAFEWIGRRNYLGELSMGKKAADDKRSRGANFTSADFAVRFRRSDKQVQIVLGEWKYTERYAAGKSMRFSRSKTDRLQAVYREHLSNRDCQVRLPKELTFEDLFFDPFDQMMRLQLLATAMEKAREDADIVSVLHVAPRANKELMDRITSPAFSRVLPGKNLHEIQNSIVIKDRFQGLHTEDLIPVVTKHAPEREWAEYIKVRYGWPLQ